VDRADEQAMSDFWLSCGHHLLDRDADGRLVLTGEFLKAYLARPELVPPAEACAAERALYQALLDDPHCDVAADTIAAIADDDARDNWQHMIGFRDHLVACETIEAAYLALVRQKTRVPLLFLDQLVHVILRNALDRSTDPYVLRAAELFFRPQLLTVVEGSVLAADAEHVDAKHVDAAGQSPLAAMFGLPFAGQIEVLGPDNAASYFERSDRFDLALDLTGGRQGLAALAEAMRLWIAHLLAVEVDIAPLTELREARLTWYVGLDAEATGIGDLVWRGEALDEATKARIIGLYRLDFRDPAAVLDAVKNEPVYLILAMTADRTLRLKPQNLVNGLPITQVEAVS
jgi:Family of unknown function (DUF6352)